MAAFAPLGSLTLAAYLCFCPAATAVNLPVASLGQARLRRSPPEPEPERRVSLGPMADLRVEVMWTGEGKEEEKQRWVNKDIVAVTDAPEKRQRNNQRRGIVMFHMWKTGGTSLCALAQLNGEHIQRAGLDEWGCSLTPNYYNSHPPDQMAIEGNVTYLETDPMKGSFRKYPLGSPESPWYFVTVLRRPAARMTSEWRHFTGLRATGGKDLRHNNTAMVAYASENRRSFANLQVEWLSNHGDLAEAKVQLEKFDEVFLTEFIDNNALPRLHRFGWTADPGVFLHTNAQPKPETLTDEQTALLNQYGADDYELYGFAKTLASRAPKAKEATPKAKKAK